MGITSMFKKLGAHLVNDRWSWGGIAQDGTVVLRVWQNETKRIDGRLCIQLTHREVFSGHEGNLGYQERMSHVGMIRSGAKCQMIVCVPKDANAVPRKIGSFNEREVFVAGELIEYAGDYWAPIAARVPAVRKCNA